MLLKLTMTELSAGKLQEPLSWFGSRTRTWTGISTRLFGSCSQYRLITRFPRYYEPFDFGDISVFQRPSFLIEARESPDEVDHLEKRYNALCLCVFLVPNLCRRFWVPSTSSACHRVPHDRPIAHWRWLISRSEFRFKQCASYLRKPSSTYGRLPAIAGLCLVFRGS